MSMAYDQAIMPSGVVELCRYWFDEDCPVDKASEIAGVAIGESNPFKDCCMAPDGEGLIVWVKSRLMERNVLRALARELNKPDGSPLRIPEIPDHPTEEQRWRAPRSLGFVRSRISRSPLVIQPINSVADRVLHFDDHQNCPYCRAWFRNGAALRLHVIERHGAEV